MERLKLSIIQPSRFSSIFTVVAFVGFLLLKLTQGLECNCKLDVFDRKLIQKSWEEAFRAEQAHFKSYMSCSDKNLCEVHGTFLPDDFKPTCVTLHRPTVIGLFCSSIHQNDSALVFRNASRDGATRRYCFDDLCNQWPDAVNFDHHSQKSTTTLSIKNHQEMQLVTKPIAEENNTKITTIKTTTEVSESSLSLKELLPQSDAARSENHMTSSENHMTLSSDVIGKRETGTKVTGQSGLDNNYEKSVSSDAIRGIISTDQITLILLTIIGRTMFSYA